MTETLRIGRAEPRDAAAIHALQGRAFAEEGRLCGTPHIPPLMEPVSAIEGHIRHQTVLLAWLEGRLVGAARGLVEGGVCTLRGVIVEPDCHGRGIGSRLVRAVEAAHPAVERFELMTNTVVPGNVAFYERHGYAVIEHVRHDAVITLAHMGKPGPRAAAGAALPLLQVEPLRAAHLDELGTVLRHPAVYAHIGGAVPSAAEFRLGMERALSGPPAGRAADERWLNYLVRDASGVMVGRLEATVHHGLAEVAYLLGPAHWGRGLATAGLHWLHAELAQHHGVTSFWAATEPANAHSARLLQRCGYRAAPLPSAPLYSFDAGDLVFHRAGVSASDPPGPRSKP